jgi:hypothetical protein
MKSFLLAAIATVAVSFGAYFILNGQFQSNSMSAFTTEGVRLSTDETAPSTN